jgi:hypothetical protein
MIIIINPRHKILSLETRLVNSESQMKSRSPEIAMFSLGREFFGPKVDLLLVHPENTDLAPMKS